METISLENIQVLKRKVLSNFSYFSQCLLDANYYDEKFHTDLCLFLQGSGYNKLVVLPRTFLKTTIAASLYPLWKAVNNTSIRILIVSNTQPNAQKTVRFIRNMVENNPMFQMLFPETIPEFGKVRWSDSCACLRRKEDYPEGTFEAVGTGTNVIRRHFNLIIEDDTVAPRKDELSGDEVMPTKDDIDKAIGFHKLTVPLLIDEFDERIVIATRWASYDVVQYVKDNEKFDEFDRPAFDESGNILYKKFSMERLDAIKLSMGSYLFSSLYLNKPLAKEFMIFNPDKLSYYEESELPEDGYTVVTIDPADPPTGKRTQSYSGIVSCKHCKSGIYARRYVRKRLTSKEIIDETLRIAGIDSASKIRIEADRYANLKYGFREAMSQLNVYYIVEEVKTRGRNKDDRIRSRLQPMFENGVIKLKRGMGELEQELFEFPYGKFKDLIDSLSWQIEGIYPGKMEVKRKKRRLLPTIGEMVDDMKRRRVGRNYPIGENVLIGRP